MAPLFAKRLNCFYCGRRSAQTDRDSVRKWRCTHCEAVNYLDEKGEITDPPATETNPNVYGPGAPEPPFESADLTGSGLFCSHCVRNQHLFTNGLASYFPAADDPEYGAYEREYPKFRKNLEERYPQVCTRCEPRVRQRIRQTGYEAKSDHLRRMMERSKEGRAARQARNWNWRSLLVFGGAMGYWISIAGQLSWDLWSALTAVIDEDSLRAPDAFSGSSPSILSCASQTLWTRQLPSDCMIDLAPYAGLSLVAGILSLWYNPKLRLKVEGRGGRFVGLGEYYKVQLITTVVRCVFWGVLRDPSSSGLDPSLPSALHWFMVLFTVLSVVVSRRIVQYDTRPLVTWTDLTPAPTPQRKVAASPLPGSSSKMSSMTPNGSLNQTTPRFPLEKLATPQPTPQPTPQREPAIPTPPPEGDDMDWTPSVQQHDIRPAVSVQSKDRSSVLDGPLPFYGSLPAAPKPPSWTLRTQAVQRQKPLDQIVEPNPFHRTPTQPSKQWQRNNDTADNVFAPPKFFPMSDHVASTGLENLFDRTFTIKSPEDEDGDGWQPRPETADARSQAPTDLKGYFIVQYLRLGLLLASIASWLLSQHELIAVPGNYIEVGSLGSASLLAGFALLEVLKQPIVQWNGMEILVYFAELVAAVHLGGNLPRASLERHYFDRYGKLLLIFMAVQEALGLLSLYQLAARSPGKQAQPPKEQSASTEASREDPPRSPAQIEHGSRFGSQPFNSPSSVPPLSFSSSVTGSSFNQPVEVQQRSAFAPLNSGFSSGFNRDHSFSLNSLKDNESDGSDVFDRDSDTETTATATTTATSNTIRNIRYGRSNNDNNSSPRKSELGSGFGGLSLEDNPRRMTRSQTQRLQGSTRRTPLRNLR
ncbi:hypothetical protein P170DRAFT_387979 [Aspergillus steynii IBT 23096]|uniref:Ima1 N-terminal domain-containing protein n=1 Tax=Aspergillus steynii IBT 23096 TaxID=1392250 RepID=A0A2I2G238_9EURO|nr:uncharacterized protein P170DRAFT_387979 [Aspergillus steynii IBT 23096]PLB46936.1 hypothetical protein P170DRAFT_387979 [Aspergillus steynii IBT 23096]